MNGTGLQCSECVGGRGERNVYTTRHQLEVHVRTDHVLLMPYRCQFCPCVRLPTEQSLKEHLMTVHSDEQNPKISFAVKTDLEERVVEILRASIPDVKPVFEATTQDSHRNDMIGVPLSERTSSTPIDAISTPPVDFAPLLPVVAPEVPVVKITSQVKAQRSGKRSASPSFGASAASGSTKVMPRQKKKRLYSHPLKKIGSTDEDEPLDADFGEHKAQQLVDGDADTQQQCAMCGVDVPMAERMTHIQENHVGAHGSSRTTASLNVEMKQLFIKCFRHIADKSSSSSSSALDGSWTQLAMDRSSSRSSINQAMTQLFKATPLKPRVECQLCHMDVSRKEISTHVFKRHVKQWSYRCSACEFAGEKAGVEKHIRQQRCWIPTEEQATAVNQRGDFEEDVQKFYTRCFPEIPFKYRPRKSTAPATPTGESP